MKGAAENQIHTRTSPVLDSCQALDELVGGRDKVLVRGHCLQNCPQVFTEGLHAELQYSRMCCTISFLTACLNQKARLTERHTHKHVDMQTDRQTDRQTDIQRDKQATYHTDMLHARTHKYALDR